MGRGAGGVSWWWWWDGLWGLNETNMGSSLGDASHHVINVGTCRSNQHDSMWAGGSVVECTLL